MSFGTCRERYLHVCGLCIHYVPTSPFGSEGTCHARMMANLTPTIVGFDCERGRKCKRFQSTLKGGR